MNKRGFTLVELIVSFAIITIISISLFKTVLTMQQKEQQNLAYNQYVSFVATFNNTIEDDLLNDTILDFTACGTNCYDISYENIGIKRITIDRDNNIMTYGSIKEDLPDNYIFYGDLSLTLYKANSASEDNYNSSFQLVIPIKSNLTEEYKDIKYIYQFDDREDAVTTNGLNTLTVNPNEGTYEGSSTSTIYYLPVGTTQVISDPVREDYDFDGWSLTYSDNLVGTTYTMGENDDTLTAIWVVPGPPLPLYTYTGDSTVVDDGDGNWRIKFLTSGTFTPLVNMVVDTFLVGGGGSGSAGGSSQYHGAGGGGYTELYGNTALVADTEYSIIVGAGGTAVAASTVGNAGESSSAFGYSAAGGQGGLRASAGGKTGGDGGSGGGGYNASGGFNGGDGGSDTCTGGIGQDTNTYEFGNSSLTLYSTGGTVYANLAGGANTGNGGSSADGSGYAGGSGIVVIRNQREAEVGSTTKYTFIYSGAFEIIDGDTDDWKIKFLSSGELTVDKNITIDAFLVGGGGSGSSGGSSKYHGAGGGGYTANYSNISITSSTTYSIVVGYGGTHIYSSSTVGNAGGTSSAFGYSAAGGQGGLRTSAGGKTGGDGGSGGGGYNASGGTDGSDGGSDTCTGGIGQGTTTKEFEETTGTLYSTGGTVYANIDGGANTGDGGSSADGTAYAGGSGVVVIRAS